MQRRLWIPKTVQRSALCRSRRELSNEYLLAKFGFDTSENEPHYFVSSSSREFEFELWNFEPPICDPVNRSTMRRLQISNILRESVVWGPNFKKCVSNAHRKALNFKRGTVARKQQNMETILQFDVQQFPRSGQNQLKFETAWNMITWLPTHDKTDQDLQTKRGWDRSSACTPGRRVCSPTPHKHGKQCAAPLVTFSIFHWT